MSKTVNILKNQQSVFCENSTTWNKKMGEVDSALISWSEKIDEAEKTGRFTTTDQINSESWMRCVFGEKLKLTTYPEFSYEAELTPEAYAKGSDFAVQVKNHQIQKAKKTYNEIMNMKTIWRDMKPIL